MLTPVAVPSAPSRPRSSSELQRTPDAQLTPAERQTKERIRAGLEQLGGVVHGGYQIDIFGTKRGRCRENPKCFRYLPGNHKMNGCAMKGMGAATCTRCGWSTLEHEDLGKWEEGDPMLVDEHGDGWRFENAAEGGIRKVKMQPPGRR